MGKIVSEYKTERASFRLTPKFKKEVDTLVKDIATSTKSKYTLTDYLTELILADFSDRGIDIEGGNE